jgi:hypothetical protein
LTAWYSVGVVHILDILEAVSQVADEGVVEVFEHPPLADDILYALGFYGCSYGMAVSVGLNNFRSLEDVALRQREGKLSRREPWERSRGDGWDRYKCKSMAYHYLYGCT